MKDYSKFLLKIPNAKFNNDEVILKCPFSDCNKERHLYCSVSTGLWICHRCGRSGNFYTLLKQFKVIGILGDNEFDKSKDDYKNYKEERIIDEKDFQFELKNFNSKETIYYQYLIGRGLSDLDIKKFDIGYCSRGFLANRIIFPIKFNNNIIGYVGRAVDDFVEKRYLNTNFDKADILYNYDNINGFELVLTEGIFDVISLSRVYPNVVGLLGKSLSEKQFWHILRLNPQHVLIALDNDVAFKNLKDIALKFYERGIKVSIFTYENFKYKDFGDADIDSLLSFKNNFKIFSLKMVIEN